MQYFCIHCAATLLEGLVCSACRDTATSSNVMARCCNFCGGTLGQEHRGVMCGTCWRVHVAKFHPTVVGMRVLEGQPLKKVGTISQPALFGEGER